MRLLDLQEMAKAITAKVCGKCNNPIVDRNYYYYKGGYFHKGGCAGAATTAAPGTPAAPRSPSAPRAGKAPPQPPSPQMQVEAWLLRHGIKDYRVHADTLVVDVDGDVQLDIDASTKLPVVFGVVTGNFDVGGSMLTTLEGCPRQVGRTFDCSNTDITSFEGGPDEVGAAYVARNLENLVTFKGLPRVVPSLLDLDGKTKVKTVEFLPEKMGKLRLPSNAMSYHNIHKVVKYIRTSIILDNPSIATNAETYSTHWLGILFIEGLRDGIKSSCNPIDRIFNAVLRDRYSNDEPSPEVNKDEEPLPYRDVLAIQEKMIDAGYAKAAKL